MKKSTKRGQRIEIRPAKINGKKHAGFRVVTIAQNGEVLSTSEVLTTPANVRKNIAALITLFMLLTWHQEKKHEYIIDLTGKVIKPVKK